MFASARSLLPLLLLALCHLSCVSVDNSTRNEVLQPNSDTVTGLSPPTGYQTPKEGIWSANWNCCDKCWVVTMVIDFDFSGTGHFSATIKSEAQDPSDTITETFAVLDSDGKKLFTVGPFTSPKMTKKGELKLWTQNFTYPTTDNLGHAYWNDMQQCDRSKVACGH